MAKFNIKRYFKCKISKKSTYLNEVNMKNSDSIAIENQTEFNNNNDLRNSKHNKYFISSLSNLKEDEDISNVLSHTKDSLDSEDIMKDNNELNVIIQDAVIDNNTNIVYYHIYLKDHYGYSVQVYKRYNDFITLHKEISKYMNVPNLPENGLLTYLNRHSTSLIKSRTEILENILQVIMNNSLLYNNKELKDFWSSTKELTI